VCVRRTHVPVGLPVASLIYLHLLAHSDKLDSVVTK
jgi:hypothetical protein